MSGRNEYVTAAWRNINNNFNITFITCKIVMYISQKRNQLVVCELSQKWEGLCGAEHWRHMGHLSLSGKDKVFPNEDLLCVLPSPETTDVHFIPNEIHPQAIKHSCTTFNTLQSFELSIKMI